MLALSLYEASITVIPKPDKDTPRKDNYSTISLKSIDAKILNKRKQMEFNSTFKESYIMIQCDLFQGCKDVLTSADPPMINNMKDNNHMI